MAVMTAVTEPSRYDRQLRYGHGKKKRLASVSAPEFIFPNQKVGSLIVVSKSPNVSAVLHIRNPSPTNEIIGQPHLIGSSLTQLISP